MATNLQLVSDGGWGGGGVPDCAGFEEKEKGVNKSTEKKQSKIRQRTIGVIDVFQDLIIHKNLKVRKRWAAKFDKNYLIMLLRIFTHHWMYNDIKQALF